MYTFKHIAIGLLGLGAISLYCEKFILVSDNDRGPGSVAVGRL